MEANQGTDSQDSDDLIPPGTSVSDFDTTHLSRLKSNAVSTPKSSPGSAGLQVSSKGIENAKKRLRAFSIQKKTPLTPISVPKPISTGSTTVLIGKLSSVKVTPKQEPAPGVEKLPKPPKPGSSRRHLQDSYSDLQKRTLSEIEDMKRKMELVELGIPLGLICPTSTSEKAMPTKAMPPIKSFLDPSKVDELIREAKKAKAEGREFKFDYQKLLPDYDNPFQRKKDEPFAVEKEKKDDDLRGRFKYEKKEDRKERKSDKYEKEHSFERRDSKEWKDDHKNKDKHRDRSKEKDKERSKDSKSDEAKTAKQKDVKETDVILNEYLVCDSWSLDNDDKTASPKDKRAKNAKEPLKDPIDLLKESIKKKDDRSASRSPAGKPTKIEKLKPVIDSFKFEIDPNEDEALDIFDEDCEIEKFAQVTTKRDRLYDSPIDTKLFDYDQDMSKEGVIDANDDNFLESVINEIKQENMSDEASQDKGLVEYDMSPKEDEDSKLDMSQGSVTPELDDRMRDLQSSRQSQYSDGYRSTESYKSSDSGYKSKDSRRRPESRQSDFRLSVEKDLDVEDQKMARSTMDCLETWSFVLKICQPLLFRHDKNNCYKETLSAPKLWFAENPKVCSCVKDRSVVYDELEMCKMSLVDRVYGCDQIAEGPSPTARGWYPRLGGCLAETRAPQLSSEWETEAEEPRAAAADKRSTTPQHDEMCLDKEYQRFMEAVWPEVTEAKVVSRSTTPVRQETSKKKKIEAPEREDDRKKKKIKLSSEGWSQESDLEEETEKTSALQPALAGDLFDLSPSPITIECKKIKSEKSSRKRKRSTSTISESDSADGSIKKKKIKKKESKKLKTKLAKRRRMGKKIKKLKEKQNKKKKIEKISDESELDKKEKKKIKKARKKKEIKLKKTQKKKKTKVSSSSSSTSSSSSSSDSESDDDRKKKKKKEVESRKKKDKKKKRKMSTDSSQSEDLFDVNILNNIKSERLSDDEKNSSMNDFSPRRQKPKEREIINVKELQNDFVGSNIHIKKEKEEMEDRDLKVNESEDVEQKTPEMEAESPPLQTEEETKPSQLVEVEETSLQPVPIQPTENIPLPELPNMPQSAPDSPPKHSPQPTQKLIPTLIPQPTQSPLPQPTQVSTAMPMSQTITQVNNTISSPQPTHLSTQQPTHLSIQQPTQMPTPQPTHSPTPQPTHLTPQPTHLLTLPTHSPTPQPTHLPTPMPTLEPLEPAKPVEMSMPIQPQIMEYNYGVQGPEVYQKGIEDCDDKFGEYDQENYEMYEHMAMAYQSIVAANQEASGECVPAAEPQSIETVVRSRPRGEIKCDWRAGDAPARTMQARPSRWGLKPGEVNIVLTGGQEPAPQPEPSPQPQPVYKIQSLANRQDTGSGYDEAYMDMYGASDRLQYGDCFGASPPAPQPRPAPSSLDERISQALRDSVLGEAATEIKDLETDKDTPEKGILVTGGGGGGGRSGSKRVSFADGYKPGQDSDTEDPPVKKKRKPRRYGCAWPCPSSHPDHVPLWDALPPPPPPPGSPPPPPAPRPPPARLLRARSSRPSRGLLPTPPHPHPHSHAASACDPNSPLAAFMPPEPPPGLLTFP